MPQVIEKSLETFSAPPRIRWTREQFTTFVEQCLPHGRYELIEGDIYSKMGQRPPHALAVSRLFAWCLSIFEGDTVLSQASINVAPEDNPTNEPEPDIFVLRRSGSHFLNDYPAPEDLLLVCEVSDSTLRFDLTTKADLYARAGIVEYWVVDALGRGLTIHRDPHAGKYRSVVRYAADETVAPLAKPQAQITVAQLLPPLTSE
jgi:Uma2 family endonuclease